MRVLPSKGSSDGSMPRSEDSSKDGSEDSSKDGSEESADSSKDGSEESADSSKAPEEFDDEEWDSDSEESAPIEIPEAKKRKIA